MKKFILILIISVMSISSYAQYSSSSRSTYSGQTSMYLFADGGYFFGGRLNDYSLAEFNIGNAPSYSVGFGFAMGRNREIELTYIGTNPKASLTDGDVFSDAVSLRTNCNFFQLGFVNFADLGPIRPFYSISLGASYMNINYLGGIDHVHSDNYDSSLWNFAASVGLGLKIDVSQKIGLKIQGRLLMPMSFYGLGIGLSGGYGGIYPTFSLNSYSLMFNGDVTFGIFYKF